MKFEKANSEELPFEDEKFDISFCLSSLEHMKNPDEAIKEMIRVTKKNGLLIFTADVAERAFQDDNWNINKGNFEDLIRILKKDCVFFSEPHFTHPDDYINRLNDAMKSNKVRRQISKIIHKIKNKDYPANFYVFGSAWLKK